MKFTQNLARIGCAAFWLFAVSGILSSCSHKEAKSDDTLANANAGSSAGTNGAGNAASENDLKTVYFDYDSYELSKGTRDALRENATWLKPPGSTIQIEGHCDERGSAEYNMALGQHRADVAKKFLIKLGVEKSRVSVISYGNERPADPGHDEAAWSKNRRDVSAILSSGASASNPGNTN